MYAHLRAQGVDVEPPVVTGYGFDVLVVQDPDGYYVCFHWPAKNHALGGREDASANA
jgi:hypothetical protein